MKSCKHDIWFPEVLVGHKNIVLDKFLVCAIEGLIGCPEWGLAPETPRRDPDVSGWGQVSVDSVDLKVPQGRAPEGS